MKYFGNWECKEDVARDFQVEVKDLGNVLFAWYGYGDYEGSAFVLFENDGKMYEVNAGHCSCYGLEGQWDPEEASVEALAHTLKEGYRFSSYYEAGDEARAALERFLKRQKRK
jgi:hypothetical protein